MTDSEELQNYTLNIGLHVLIIFTFLTIFFFAYVSKLESRTVQRAFDKIIEKEVYKFLTSFDNYATKLHLQNSNFLWNSAYKLAENIEKDSQGELESVKKHNNKLKFIAMGIIISFSCLLIFLYVYFRRISDTKINFREILIDNLIIFAFIGMIEFYFFTKIASKIIPVTPDFVSLTILDRIKYNTTQRVVSRE